ncbi:hypothetical protein OC842_003217 [Tilletia horrida]|uniref:Uncharacterized protein n=1 Tax=Tilletia horrida TaxID=155126 RepID=A0AAN6GGH1_9BASI|nr:hypothetical protein OC842_003217 [Tilletia horrida]
MLPSSPAISRRPQGSSDDGEFAPHFILEAPVANLAPDLPYLSDVQGPLSPSSSTKGQAHFLPSFDTELALPSHDSAGSDRSDLASERICSEAFPTIPLWTEKDGTPEPTFGSADRALFNAHPALSMFPDEPVGLGLFSLPTAVQHGGLPMSPPPSAGQDCTPVALPTIGPLNRLRSTSTRVQFDPVSEDSANDTRTVANKAEQEKTQKRRRRQSEPERPNALGLYNLTRPEESSSRKRRNTVAVRTSEDPASKALAKPPRGQLRYRDGPDPEPRKRSKSNSSSSLPDKGPSENPKASLIVTTNGQSPIKVVSLKNIDRSKCITTEQILGFNLKNPPRALTQISCAIEDEEMDNRAKAALAATRARLGIKEDLVRPPENAITNVVSADMRPEQAEEAIKWSKVAMREAKQTQAMLMYAMDHADDRRKQSRVSFSLPDQQVYALLVDSTQPSADGGDAQGDGNTISASSSKTISGLVSAMRGGRAQNSDIQVRTGRTNSLASDSSASASGSTFSSVGSGMSSSGSGGDLASYPLSYNVAPPIPAYAFAVPNFQLAPDAPQSTDGALGNAGSAAHGPPCVAPPEPNAAQAIPWDMALQAQAAQVLNSFALPNTAQPMGTGLAPLPIPLPPPDAATAAPSDQQPVQMGSNPDVSPTSSNITPMAVEGNAMLASTSFPNFANFNLVGSEAPPLFDPSRPRQRAITATGIERLLGSATIADHTRSMPEPAMNPCTLYPPGQTIAYQEWLQQQRFIGMIGAEPQLLPPAPPAPIPTFPSSSSSGLMLDLNAGPTQLPSTGDITAGFPSSIALGKRKSTEDSTESDGWTSAYPPPLPGGRGTKKRGRPRSRSDIPPKAKPLASLSAAGNSENGGASVPVMHGPELPPGVKKDVPIAAPSRVPLKICAPVARRGVGKASSQSSTTSASPASTTSSLPPPNTALPCAGGSGSRSLEGSAPPEAGVTFMMPFSNPNALSLPTEEPIVPSNSTTPRPSVPSRVRSATTSLLLPGTNSAMGTSLLAGSPASGLLPHSASFHSFFPALEAQSSFWTFPTLLTTGGGTSTSSSNTTIGAGTGTGSHAAMMAAAASAGTGGAAWPAERRKGGAISVAAASRSANASRRSSASSAMTRGLSAVPEIGIVVASGSGSGSSSRPNTGNTAATATSMASTTSSTSSSSASASVSTGSNNGELMFVTYGMEDAKELRQAVAPSGNYKVPLSAKRRKLD